MEKSYVEKRDGGYWITGTRVSFDSVIFVFRDGLSPETIAAECFPALSLEQVYGAITHYLARREEMDLYLQRTEAEFEALRQATHTADPEFYNKLVQAKRQFKMVQA